MKLICFLAVALALCAGARASKSFDLIKGSPVSVSVEFEPALGTMIPAMLTTGPSGGRRLRRNLLDVIIPANLSSIPGADEILPILTGASEDSVQNSNSTSESAAQDSTVAGRHLLTMNTMGPGVTTAPPKPFKFNVPFSVKKSALSSFVTIAVDFSGADATAVLKGYKGMQSICPTPRPNPAQAVNSAAVVATMPPPCFSLIDAEIVVFPEVAGAPEIVEIVESDFCVGSDGKGRTEVFGFKGDVKTFEAFTAWGTTEQPKTGAKIYIVLEVKITIQGQRDTYALFIIPATDFKVEKYSLPTVQGFFDTLCA